MHLQRPKIIMALDAQRVPPRGPIKTLFRNVGRIKQAITRPHEIIEVVSRLIGARIPKLHQEP